MAGPRPIHDSAEISREDLLLRVIDGLLEVAGTQGLPFSAEDLANRKPASVDLDGGTWNAWRQP